MTTDQQKLEQPPTVQPADTDGLKNKKPE